MSTPAAVDAPSVEVSAEDVANLVRSKGFHAWRQRVESVAGCARPIQLHGSSTLTDTTTGQRVGGTAGLLFVACGNRRASVCQPCSERYAADTFHLIRSGMVGGKDVPATVASHVRVFTTLTAPSFGQVHNQPRTRAGKPRPCACGEWHHDADPRLGAALDPAAYDYVGAVLWQNHAPELWRRFTIACARHLAHALGVSATALKQLARVSYAKVAEYQRRGLVHFHAVVRVDGPDGPGSLPPVEVTAELLSSVIRTAASSITLTSPECDATGTRDLVWGSQVDTAPIAPERATADPGALAEEHGKTDSSVAGYIAKYATKGTGASAGTDRPIRSAAEIETLPISEHHKTMMATAWWLGGLPEFSGLLLRKWAHMLGFRGHFLTKSRRYSVTFTSLRDARKAHQLAASLAELGITDTDRITVTGEWVLAGIGYRSAAEREFAGVLAESVRTRRAMRGGRDPDESDQSTPDDNHTEGF